MRTIVIYHSADFDGIFCREIAKKFLPEAELVGWDFCDDPLVMKADTHYTVMDLPIDRVFGWKFKNGYVEFQDGKGCPVAQIDWPIVTWIDHHKSSIETHPTDIPGYRMDGVAACRLAWQWFSNLAETDEGQEPCLPSKSDYIERRVTEPIAVRLAGEYDIWDKRDPNAELFQHGLRSEPLTEETWFKLLYYVNAGITVDRLLAQGKTLQFARDQEYAEVIQQQGFDLQWEGLNWLACNSHELDIRSHLFAAGLKPEHRALLGFTYHGRGWRVSMYHAPGYEQFDLSTIAKKYGGGGHRGACGFQAPTLPFAL